jgi:hypothetical protein
MLLDPAISRSRGGVLLGCGTKELVRGCSEAAEQELGGLAGAYGASGSRRVRANGDTQCGNPALGQVFGGAGPPRARVGAAVATGFGAGLLRADAKASKDRKDKLCLSIPDLW